MVVAFPYFSNHYSKERMILEAFFWFGSHTLILLCSSGHIQTFGDSSICINLKKQRYEL